MLAVLILFPSTVILVARIPAVQTFIARKATNYLSELLQTEISVGSVNLNFSLDLVVEDLLVKDQQKAVLLDLKKLQVDVRKISTKSRMLKFNKIIIDNALINFIKYKEDSIVNFRFIIDGLSSEDTTKVIDTIPWLISVSDFRIVDSRFKYHDQNKERKTDQIDFDNVDLAGLNIAFRDLEIEGDTIIAMINKIKLTDHSGFAINEFSSDFRISPAGLSAKDLLIETGNTNLAMDLIFDYDDFSYFNDFLHDVKIKSVISESSIDFSDLGYFAPDLKQMKNDIKFSGIVNGSVDNLKVRDFNFSYGQSTNFFGTVRMNGLPDIEETFINANIKVFETSIADLKKINVPGVNAQPGKIELDESFDKFGNVSVKGKFTGFYNDFVANAEVISSLGKLNTDVVIERGNVKEPVKYYGKIEAENFDFGTFSGLQKYFGKLNLIADISGSGLDEKNIEIEMNGTIDSLDFNDINYSSIALKGNYANQTFNGSLQIFDEIINLDFSGIIDFSREDPVFDFTSSIHEADLNRLKLVTSDDRMKLSTKLNINFTGLSVDSIMGKIVIDSTLFSRNDDQISMDRLSLDVFNDTIGKKKIQLISDFFDLDMHGDFQLSDIVLSFDEFLDRYISSVDILKEDSLQDETTEEQIIAFEINLKNTSPVSRVFLPELEIAKKTVITGKFNSVRGVLEFDGKGDYLNYLTYKFDDFFIKGMSGEKNLLLRTGCERLNFSDSLGIDDFAINARLYNDSLEYNLLWKNHDTIRNMADIAGFVNFNTFPRIESRFTRFNTYINDSLWDVSKGNYIIIDTSYVEVNKLEFSSETQFIKINGKISEIPGNSIDLEFRNFDISNFDVFLRNDDIDVDGFLNGKAKLMDIYTSPNFVSDLNIQDLRLNNDKLGNALIKSNWNDLEQSLYLKTDVIYKGNYGENKTFLADGYYYPKAEDQNFDIDLEINNFKIKTISGLFSDFSSDAGGLVTGNVKLRGSLDQPDITGKIKLLRTYLKVDYLNTKYSFTDEITINKDNLSFSDFIVYDSLGNTATINGMIRHNNFSDFYLDVNVKPQNLSCLNTSYSQNDEFYGNVFFTGDLHVKGALSDIMLDITGKTEKKTRFTIPLSSTSEVSRNNYITFVNPKDTVLGEEEEKPQVSNLSMDLKLNVTSDAGIEIIMPAQSGNIKASGDGYIRLEISPAGEFNIYGDYVISKGSYLFTLQNVINKHFNIRSGGKIKWNGDPTDAEISLRAVYSIRTPLSGLMLATDTTGSYNQRIPVDCILDLRGKLFNPDIRFSLELPGSDYETRQLVYSQIDTSNQSQMSEQMIFLLVLNQFKPVSGSDVAMYSGVGTTSFDILTNQLSNWLSQISDDFDIGLNYRPGNEVTSEEIEVALSTQLFNDRVSIDGNFGVAGTDDTKKTSNIVGDVNVEVKITEDGRFRVKAFNKTNNVNSIEYNAPYTQGVGIFYRKEFEDLRDLFGKKGR